MHSTSIMADDPQLVRITPAAAERGKTYQQMLRLGMLGVLELQRRGKHWMITRTSLDEFDADQRTGVLPEPSNQQEIRS